MAVLTDPKVTILVELIAKAYSRANRLDPGNRKSIAFIRQALFDELKAVDTQWQTSRVALNNAFSAGFRSITSPADRSVFLIGLVIAEQLIDDPTYLNILKELTGLVQGEING